MMNSSMNMSFRNKTVLWATQTHEYEDRLQSIKRLHDSAVRNIPIDVDENMTQAENRINLRAKKLLEASYSQDSDKYPNIQSYIEDKIHLSHQKYANYDSGSQHSSEEEISLSYDVEDIVISAEKEPSPGKIIFITKVVRRQGIDFELTVENIKPKRLNIPELSLRKEIENFILWEMNTDSAHKKIAINLMLNDKEKIRTSGEIIGSRPKYIELDLQLGYDFTHGQDLNINALESLLAACVLDGEQLSQDILDIHGQKTLRKTILEGDYKIDLITRNLIHKAPKMVPMLKILKFLLKDETFTFTEAPEETLTHSFLTIAKIYLEVMIKFKPSMPGEDILTSTEVITFYELYLHLICLTVSEPRIKNFGIDEESFQENKNKIGEIFTYLFQNREISLFHKILNFCIDRKVYLLPIGCDTLKDSIITSGLNSAAVTLSHFQNLYYHYLKDKDTNLVKYLIDAFGNYNFETSNIYREHQYRIRELSDEIMDKIRFSSETWNNFDAFYRVYFKFKKHEKLSFVVRNQSLKERIVDYLKHFNTKLSKCINDQEKIIIFKTIQRINIQQRDPDIIEKEFELTFIIQVWLKKFEKNKIVFEELFKTYFEMLKRTGTIFDTQAVKSCSTIISKTILEGFRLEDSLKLLNKYFRDDFLHNELCLAILKDNVIQPLIIKNLSSQKFVVGLFEKGEHEKWHNNFQYRLEINEMIIDQILKVINKHFRSYKDKQDRMDDVLLEIRQHVHDQDKKNILMAIVKSESVDLSENKIWIYFKKDYGMIKSLHKIMNKRDDRTEDLKKSFKGVNRTLQSRDIPFEVIQGIKMMKPHEENSFKQLTEDFGIPGLVEKYFIQGKSYTDKINKFIDFVRKIGKKFESPDTDDIIGRLEECSRVFVKESMKRTTLYDNVPVFRNFQEGILKCYKFQSFYGGRKMKGMKISQIIEECQFLLIQMKKNIRTLFENCHNNTLKSSSFYFFNPKKQNLNEFAEILTIIEGGQEIHDNVEILKENYRIIAICQQLSETIKALNTIQGTKFNSREPSLLQFESICKNFSKKVEFSISDLIRKYQNAKNKLREYKLNLDNKQAKDILDLLLNLTQNKELHELLKDLRPYLAEMKEKINDVGSEGGELTSEEINYCEFVLEFMDKIYSQEYFTFTDFIQAIIRFDQNKKKTNRSYNLSKMIKAVIKSSQALKEEKANIKDRDRNFYKHTLEISISVKAAYRLDEENRNRVRTVIKIAPEGQAKQITEEELEQYHQKALLMTTTMVNNEQEKERSKHLPSFLKIHSTIIEMKQTQQELASIGYSQFQEETKVEEIEIRKGDNREAVRIIQEKKVEATVFKEEVDDLKDINFNLSGLQGSQLSQFVNEIAKEGNDKLPPHFESFFSSPDEYNNIKKNPQVLKAIKKAKSINTPKEYLKVIQAITTSTDNHQREQIKFGDEDENFCHLICLSQEERSYLSGIYPLRPERITRMKFEHLLICTKETNQEEIKEFVDRALRDIDNEYIILGFENLHGTHQRNIIKEIKNYQNKLEKKGKDLKMKLCMVGNSEIELVYNFIKETLGQENKQDIPDAAQSQIAYLQRLAKQMERVFLVTSSKAGDGKSTFIKEHSKCSKEYHLTISGNMLAPVERDKEQQLCDKYLWDIYLKMVTSIKAKQEEKDTCIIIDLYNIESLALDNVNRFLTNLLFFRKHKFGTTVLSLPDNIPIYIELQNISMSSLLDKSKLKHKDLPVQVNLLPILKQIWINCKKQVVKVESFSIETLKMKNDDKELQYILNYLQSLESKSINTTFFPNFAEFAIKTIPDATAKVLIQKYFFDKFQENDAPSGYLWSYFKTLLVTACNSFSNSYFLSDVNLKETDSNLKQANSKLHTEFKYKQTVREQFLKVLVENCSEFIKRSVKPGDEGTSAALKETLQNIPLLIIPGTDGSSFSFIYSKSENVPPVIKRMMVLSQYKLARRINTTPVDTLFQEINIATIEKKSDQKGWIDKASEILQNISGNMTYKIDCEPGYIINIDNFFKICLIVYRMRSKIPIVIMGEAGIGKTALLRHVVNQIFKHQFKVFNINAGLPLKTLQPREEKAGKKKNKVPEEPKISLTSMIESLKNSYEILKGNPDNNKKIWVFFDEFNTLREVGFFKEIIMDKRFCGFEEQSFKECIMMAACNPHKKLQPKKHDDQIYTIEKKEKLAFDVLPAPHSLIENMWNYGGLNDYEYEKYIGRMICEVNYKPKIIPGLVLAIHSKIKVWMHDSAVSLRDIQRFRQIYRWFIDNLKELKTKKIKENFGSNTNNQERAAIMALYFTYLLRFNSANRSELEELIEGHLNLKRGLVRAIKQTEEEDFCEKLNKQWETPLVFNESLKENIYTCFVCLNTHLPLIIIGHPGSSKSLSLRLLLKNLSKSEDESISRNIERFEIQGSENTTTQDIKTVFNKVKGFLRDKTTEELKTKSLLDLQRTNVLVVFDQIGLAQKSPDNPLKVLHPYLEVNREQETTSSRLVSFIGISNSELDVSKMSRLLVLRRPPINQKDLQETATQMAEGFYKKELEANVNHYVVSLANSYHKYLQTWKAKKNDFALLYGLRDFYGVIKNFVVKLLQKLQKNNDRNFLTKCALESIFQNFNAWQGSSEQCSAIFLDYIKSNQIIPKPQAADILNNIIKNLKTETSRFPLVIAEDQESLYFIKWIVENQFKDRSLYIEGSPFQENKEYSSALLNKIGELLKQEFVMIVSNLKEAVKTGLYEVFNKSTELSASGMKCVKIKSSSKNKKANNYTIHEKFNCLYILLAQELKTVEPPFLNRFQKYRFSLKNYRIENCDNIFKRVMNFKERIESICTTNNYGHFKFHDLFMNASESSIESLAVSSFLKISNQNKKGELKSKNEFSEDGFKNALAKLLMNSGQEFYYLFKFVIEKNGDLADLKDFINEGISKKNQNEEDGITTIKFTNNFSYINTITAQEQFQVIKFETLKVEKDLETELNNFFNSDTKQELYIWMRVLQDSHYLNYVSSVVEKIRAQKKSAKPEAATKKVKIVYWFVRDRSDKKEGRKRGEKDSQIPITYFTNYSQEFDDGKLGEMGKSKQSIFSSINMQEILNTVHKSFTFSFPGEQINKKREEIFSGILKEFEGNQQHIFQQSCREVTFKLETNFELNEQMVKQILQDKETIIKSQSFKGALTKYYCNKKLFGTIGTFIKILCQKEAYLSFSEEKIFELLNVQLSRDVIQDFKQVKKGKKYKQFVKAIMETKIGEIVRTYQDFKRTKRIPNPEKTQSVQLLRPRLIPFSKVECLTILKFEDTELGWYAKQVYKKAESSKQAFQTFLKEFKLKTTFKNQKDTFYRKYLEQQSDKNTTGNPFITMLFLDLLSDFAELRNLEIKHVYKYYQVMLPMISFKDNANRFAKMVAILLGFQEIWIQLFKLIAIFNEQDCKMELRYKEVQTINREEMINYTRYIVEKIELTFFEEKSMQDIGNAEKYQTLFVNAAFQMDKIQEELEIKMPEKIKSIRTALIFLEEYEPSLKSERMSQFISRVSQDKTLSYYEHALNYFDGLGESDEDDEEKMKMLIQFKANTLFLEWFKAQRKEEEDQKCFREFLRNCKNSEVFAHNSVATISYFLDNLKLKYQEIKKTYEQLNSKDRSMGKKISTQLIKIGENSKQQNYTDNLSLVIINLFMQKICSIFEQTNIVTQRLREFEQIMELITTGQSYGVAKHFAFAFIKVYLQNYINRFVNRENLQEFSTIDKILSTKESLLCSNLRFYCLKLLRTKMTLKEIVHDYIKKKRCQWIGKINEIDFFHENQSRSLIVPKDPAKTSDKMNDLMKAIIEKEGKPDSFDELFQEGSLSPENRYSLLTFFFRFYFSKAYNHGAHRQTVLDKLTKEKAKYEGLIGVTEYQVISRYAKSEFDERLKITDPAEFNESLFFIVNPLNWLLAYKTAVSPLSSLFFNNGKFHQNFKSVFDNSFFPCGPESPFINIAQTVYQATRNQNIGVYVCSSQCDYMYFHVDCGWPTVTVPCRICGEPIGCIQGKGHTIARVEKGARRIMSTALKDKGRPYWMWNLGKVPLYNEAQRYYIQAQINRMKVNPVVSLADRTLDLRGYSIQNQGRVSILTYYLFRQIINTLLYTLLSLKVINPQEAIAICKRKTAKETEQALWDNYKADIQFIQKAVNLDRKIYGWMYGVHQYIFSLSQNFQENFNNYKAEMNERSRKLAAQMLALVKDKKIDSNYHQLYNDIALNLNNGLITKHINNITDLTAKNRMTRDALENMVQKFIKENISERKFALSENSRVFQGVLQFPNDVYLTQDKIDNTKYQFSRLFKLPDKTIKYSDIANSFQAFIKEKYPFLDYVLKNSEHISNMRDFETILTFSNQLYAEVQNTYIRKDGERSLEDFLKNLIEKRGQKVHTSLKEPKLVIEAWNRLAKKLGPLQNECTLVGRMNDELSMKTEVKAFLIDNISKKNPYGLVLSSVFHNFAEMHNTLMNTLNGRKNQIPKYKVLNLVNFSKKISPQAIKDNNVYSITEKELADKLYECSISSVSYGKNFVFTNFEAYQHHFIMKLQGKCQFSSIIEEFKSICYNGQAFSQKTESSNVISQVRNYFYEPLNENDKQKVKNLIQEQENPKKVEQSCITLRGELEKVMIGIKAMGGMVQEVTIQDFTTNNNIVTDSDEIMVLGRDLQINKIIPLYELIEELMKTPLLDSLSDDYKEKIPPETQNEVKVFLNDLPQEETEQSPSLVQFRDALYRFIARNLLSGIMGSDKIIIQYLPARDDFWPKDFDLDKLYPLTYNPLFMTLTFSHICHLFKLVEETVAEKM